MVLRLFLLLSLVPIVPAWSQPSQRVTRERTYDVLHYRLELSIDERSELCSGTVTISVLPLIENLQVLHLDAADLDIKSVTLGVHPAPFRKSGDSLLITCGRTYGVTDTVLVSVSYDVRSPKKGLYFMKPDSGSPNRRWQVWSQGEAEDNRYWFPGYDYPNDKSTSEMIVTVNEPFIAISNGKLIGVERNERERTATYHWLEGLPHVSYNISLVVGEYIELHDSWGNVPIIHYVPSDREKDALRSFSKTPKMMDYFSGQVGISYPWEKYGHVVVQDFIYSGQENVTISTLTDATLHDARAHLDTDSDELVAHELAHQWWGNLISFQDWSHAWLSEGFATYFDWLFEGHDRSYDEFLLRLREAQQIVVAADRLDRKRPTVTHRYEKPYDLFDSRIYQKGGCILHMIRNELGDELFWKTIRFYAKKYAFKHVQTQDLVDAIREASGRDMTSFFEQYVYGAGYPELHVTSHWDERTREAIVNVRQTQLRDSLTGLFNIPLDIEVWVHGQAETYRVQLTSEEEEFRFPAYQQYQLIIFDRASPMLKSVSYAKSVGEWIFQLENAEDAVDRMDAAEELRWVVDSTNVQSAFVKALLEDRFWAVRREAAWALADMKGDGATDSLIVAYGDRDARVRAAVIAALANRHNDASLSTLKHAFESDSSYGVVTAALRGLVRADSVNGKAYCLKALRQNSHQDVIRIAALNALATYNDPDVLPILREYTRPGGERNLRVLAVTLLARNGREHEEVLEYLFPLLRDPIFQVRRATIDALTAIGSPKALRPLEEAVRVETDVRLVNAGREAIRTIQQKHQND